MTGSELSGPVQNFSGPTRTVLPHPNLPGPAQQEIRPIGPTEPSPGPRPKADALGNPSNPFLRPARSRESARGRTGWETNLSRPFRPRSVDRSFSQGIGLRPSALGSALPARQADGRSSTATAERSAFLLGALASRRHPPETGPTGPAFVRVGLPAFRRLIRISRRDAGAPRSGASPVPPGLLTSG